MDPLIRSSQLAQSRTRLSQVRSHAGREVAAQQPEIDQRVEIERSVRADLTAQLREVAEEERKRAHSQGHADGLAAGRAAATVELAQLHERLTSQADRAMTAMERAHQSVLAKLESSVGEIAFAAVCRLLGSQVVSAASVVSAVEQICAEVRSSSAATARLHPRDVEVLRELMQDSELQVRGLGLKFVPDESLELGGCVIDGESGQFDGSLETQLRRLHAALAGTRNAAVQE